jgi:hypothetical protein
MKAIQQIRLRSQQLGSPDFSMPKDLVSWMGAVQAQDYGMTKWAVGVRLKSASMSNVEAALNRGEILRMASAEFKGTPSTLLIKRISK